MQPYWKFAPFVLALTAYIGKILPQSPPALPPAATTLVTTVAPDSAVTRQRLNLAQLPSTLRPAGKLLEAWRWQDTNGENTLVASRTVAIDDDQAGDGRAAHLLVRQYVRRGSNYQQLWQLQDAITDCPVDLVLGLLPGSLSVTDLNHDGRTETTVLYALTCKGDVSPSNLKLIMHEGAVKYALRGMAIGTFMHTDKPAELARKQAGPVCCSERFSEKSANYYEQAEGLYVTEKDFTNAPPIFLNFARQQWRKWRSRADEGTEAQ